jgi:hypothetical protein
MTVPLIAAQVNGVAPLGRAVTRPSLLEFSLNGGIMTYSDLLRDPRWQRRRLEIFQRDNWTCQECGSKNNTLHVHHKCYLPDISPWEYIGELLITMCKECHEIEQSVSTIEQKNLIASFYFFGAKSGDLEPLYFALSYLGKNKKLNSKDWRELAELVKEFCKKHAQIGGTQVSTDCTEVLGE